MVYFLFFSLAVSYCLKNGSAILFKRLSSATIESGSIDLLLIPLYNFKREFETDTALQFGVTTMLIMLDFLNNSKCNSYFLIERLNDCETSLSFFNYVTPMAICIEAILKITGQHLDLDYTDDELDNAALKTLLMDNKIKKELYNWGIKQTLIDNIDSTIREKNNDYKHSLIKIKKPSPTERFKMFKLFYEFVSFYYEHCTGKQAPAWDDRLFDSLLSKENNEYDDRKRAMQLR